MSSKSKKAAAPGGVDIRAFFSGSSQTKASSSSQAKPSQQSQKTNGGSSLKRKAEVDDDHDTPPKKKAASKARKVIDISDDDDDAPPPLPKTAAKRSKAVLVSSDEEEPAPKKAKPRPKDDTKPAPKRKKPEVILSSDDDEASPSPKKKSTPAKLPAKTVAKPRKSGSSKKKDEEYSVASDDDDDDLIPTKSKGKQPAPKKKAPAKEKAKKEADGEEEPKKKFNYYAHQAAKKAAPTNYGAKEVPDGSPDCLAGLSFVFTGELSSFSRDDAISIAKRFGGRVVGQPSTRTDYVVLGDNAGPSKLAAIKKHGIRTLDEDAFLDLIAKRTGTGEIDEKTKKKMEKEQKDIKIAAKEMEKREKQEAKASASSGHKGADPSMQLWTTRYAPQSLKEICGNKSSVEKLLLWLQEWPASYKADFKKPGKNAMNTNRAVLITGPPGIGKTTSAHLCAKLAGYTPIELNASDARSKKLVENGMNINNTSLDSYIGGSKQTNSLGVAITDRTCLIMDEVDGMSSGDRGGVGALNALIKKSKIPIICIANDKGAQKLKPLQATTFGMSFHKPPANQVRSRIMTITFKEKMDLPGNVIDQLITGSQSDIRQVLNMLSTWKLSSSKMTFDEGKTLTKMNEKYQIMSPFDITSKILGPYMFSPTEKKSLGDKMELYFQDHSFVPLFIQENYLKSQPTKLRNLEGPEKALKQLELMDRAASSISDGDLVDGMIHGPEQHWALMPLHAVCSTVRPASFVFGQGAHYGGPMECHSLNGWMRLKASGDKHELRQQYIPALFPHIVRPLIEDGSDAVEDIIECMDGYYLNKDDWDSVVELGVDTNKDDIILKKIPAAVKTAFTRKYNASEHPIAYHKAQDLGKAPKKLASAGEKPDLEDAFEMDEEVVEGSDDEESSGSGGRAKKKEGIEGDKLLQAAKPKKKPGRVGLGSAYDIFIDSPDLDMEGQIHFQPRAPAHYPCGPAVAGQNMAVGPNIGWANAVPDAAATVDMMVGGTRLTFKGAGYHDKTWSPQPFGASVALWYWGHGRVGPYSVVWFDSLNVDGTEHGSAYVAKDNTILVASCDLSSIRVRPTGENATYPPGSDTGLPSGYHITLDLGPEGVLEIDATVVESLMPLPWYGRFVGNLRGSITPVGGAGGDLMSGVALFEQLKPNEQI
ncbi:RFC1-domain-containing protein [Hymenopellis radicata]|nr:RFC1-domain-containing protein [Hymenopellis radicata]